MPQSFASLSPFRTGDVVDGRYLVEGELGSGGMGVVLAARDQQTGESVALKILQSDHAAQPQSAARFERETRAASTIVSPHVARVLAVGRLPTGASYMVMERLRGIDLSQLLQQRGQLSISAAVDLILQACAGVAAAHALGVIHRDLKPQNLFLAEAPTSAPVVKVLDFGLSKFSQDALSLTRSAEVMGTPLYMSPEQFEATHEVGLRSDIWSLGVILFELLAGRPPFRGERVSEVITQILLRPPPSLRSERPDVPRELEAATMRCLEKRPDRRFVSVGELAAALSPFATPVGVDAANEADRRLHGVCTGVVAAAQAQAATPSSIRAMARDTAQVLLDVEAWKGPRGGPAHFGLGAAIAFVLVTVSLVVTLSASERRVSPDLKVPHSQAGSAALPRASPSASSPSGSSTAASVPAEAAASASALPPAASATADPPPGGETAPTASASSSAPFSSPAKPVGSHQGARAPSGTTGVTKKPAPPKAKYGGR